MQSTENPVPKRGQFCRQLQIIDDLFFAWPTVGKFFCLSLCCPVFCLSGMSVQDDIPTAFSLRDEGLIEPYAHFKQWQLFRMIFPYSDGGR